MSVTPAELVADCLAGGVRRLIGGVHSLTSSRAVVVCVGEQWVRVRFSANPGALPAPWCDAGAGWVQAPRGAEPGLRDASADPVLLVVGVAATEIVAVNVLAIDEIAVTCADRDALIGNWLLQAQVQGAAADTASVAGALLSANPDATVVVADPMSGPGGWVDVLAAGTAWPVRPLTAPATRADLPADSDTRPAPDPTDSDGAAAPHAAAEERPPAGPPADGGDHQQPSPDDAADTDVDEAAAVETIAAEQDCPVGRMQVFGGFDVVDGTGAALQPMQQDIVGGLAFNAGVSTQDLCQLVFGSPDKPPSFHVALSKMRRRGINPQLVDGGYRLDIGSDWADFDALAGPDPAATDTAALAEAAALITGPIFGPRPPRWAQPLIGPMRARVAAVCRELAARNPDRPEEALRYARLGMSVDAGNTELGEIIDMVEGRLSGAGPR